MPQLTVPEAIASVLLMTPLPVTLAAAGAAAAVSAAVQAHKWLALARHARFVSFQQARPIADATAELERQRAAGRPGSIVGVFQGYLACSSTPPLAPAHSLRGAFSPLACVYHSSQIRSTGAVQPSRDSAPLSASASEVPFELCDGSGVHVHVFSRPAMEVSFRATDQATCVQDFHIDYPPYPLLRRTDCYLRVGDWVTIAGELSLQPWMSSTDLRPVLRAPDSPNLPKCVILNSDGKEAIREVLERAGQVHRRRAQLLLVLAGAIFAGAWVLWRRRQQRARRNRAIIDDIHLHARQVLGRHECHAPSSSPILSPCSLCQVRPRDCVLRDCNHQVCCLECAERLPLDSPSSTESAVAGRAEARAPGSEQEGGVDGVMLGIPKCPLCWAPVRQVLRVYTS